MIQNSIFKFIKINTGRKPKLLFQGCRISPRMRKTSYFYMELAPRPTFFTYFILKTTVYNSRLMSALAQISKFLDRINTYIGYLCGFFAFSMVIIVFTVVVLRYGFSIGFIWMQEIYVWLHSFIFMIGSGFTYLANEHVRIDVFYRDASANTRQQLIF